jgi:hypothetical protein
MLWALTKRRRRRRRRRRRKKERKKEGKKEINSKQQKQIKNIYRVPQSHLTLDV